MWGLRGASPKDFKLVELRDRSDGKGEAGIDAYPAGDQNKRLVVGASERVLGSWPIRTLSVSWNVLKPAADATNGWVADGQEEKLLKKAKGELTLTDQRLAVVIPGVPLPKTSLFRPTEVMAKMMLDSEKTIIAGHLPLESIVDGEFGKKWVNITMALQTTGRQAMYRMETSMDAAHGTQLGELLVQAHLVRWSQYELPAIVRQAIESETLTVSGPDKRRFDPALIRPVGGNVGLTTRYARGLVPELPAELRNVEPGSRAISVEEDQAARAAMHAKADQTAADAGPWTCPECGYERNPAGRIRCAQCRREVGHLV